MNKMHKSRDNKKLCGVCSGLTEWLNSKNINIDVSIIRLIWAVLALFYGVGIFTYFILALILPYGD